MPGTISQPSQTKPKKKRNRRPRNNAIAVFCQRCGIQITSRGNRARYCANCIPPKYLQHLEVCKDRQRQQRAGTLPPPKPRNQGRSYKKTQPVNYFSQHVSKTGQDFLIYVGNKLTAVPMICRKCKKDNDQVRGHWGPIYGQYDDNGNEIYQVLLCRGCYDAECEKYEAQPIAS